RLITRHQLLDDPRVPCTNKNGCASLLFEGPAVDGLDPLIEELRAGMREWYKVGSDPGLCVAPEVPSAVRDFGRRCQRELIEQEEARALASRCGFHLEGLGGTEGGVIGALAAVGLIADGNDGRVVHLDSWPDDLGGPQPVEAIRARGIDVRCLET